MRKQGKVPENEFVASLNLKKEVARTMLFGDVVKDQQEVTHLYDAIQQYKNVST